ncbi:hypothetical protein BH10BAC5_BH10BAC5_05780 [soil metagenome]
MKKVILFFLLLISADAFSQWNANSTINTPVCLQTGDQSVTKMSPTTDGGCYIAWFDNRNGVYAVYLQKLSSTGNRQFVQDGLLISSNPQSTSLVDWDMITDDSNNAVIVFTDTRNGSNINPFAYRISPTGTFLWGPNGVTLTDNASLFQPNPVVSKTSDGNFVIAWNYGSTPEKTAMQKLSPTGAKLWGAAPLFLSGTGTENLWYPKIVPSDNGSVILMYSGWIGSFLSPSSYRLYTQKFSSAGTSVWNANRDTVYSLGRVAGFYHPDMISDGNNGAVYLWNDDRNSNNQSNVFVQHYSSAGTRYMPLNGSAVASFNGNTRNTPSFSFMNTTKETYVFWKENNGGQTLMGISGQAFDSSGNIKWGVNGKEIRALSNLSFSTSVSRCSDSNAFLYVNEYLDGVNSHYNAIKFNRDGTYGWAGNTVVAGGTNSSKGYIGAVINSNSMSMLTWADGRNGPNDIYAQNVNNNGSLGNTTGIINISGFVPKNFILKQNYPNPFNPVTRINFSIPQSTFVKLSVFDMTGREISSLVNEDLSAGSYSYTFNAEKLSSGIYFYKLSSENFSETKKLMLVK